MKEWQVTLDHIEEAVTDGRLSIKEALDAASEIRRTGLPKEYYGALGVDE